jgi:hypothetical protein
MMKISAADTVGFVADGVKDMRQSASSSPRGLLLLLLLHPPGAEDDPGDRARFDARQGEKVLSIFQAIFVEKQVIFGQLKGEAA